MTDPLISTEALAARLGEPNLKLVDASWYLDKRDAKPILREARLPDAVFFDIDAVADASSGLPHMLPTPEVFADAVGALGISERDHIVCYDQQGLFSAARAWWTFRAFGAGHVQVLDGGLPKWRAEGRPVERGDPHPSRVIFHPTFHPELVADWRGVLANIDSKAFQLTDARSGERFRGEVAEARPGVRSGRVPGSFNTPFGSLLNSDGTMKDAEGLTALFDTAGLDLIAPITATCGSGLTAAVVALALARLGRWDVPVYDGSWTEWGGREDLPVAVG
ncbi:MAG TPA: 3-mercaptopyruvate sulfurtransferase [Caulobacteraceae bacterium]|jgi:thiosulfate/3-mercaptopyruvate sulfurtransferase|nr:3-mercaptopyruvate sulfurtransferase [Caulobacteraceae bacterium]